MKRREFIKASSYFCIYLSGGGSISYPFSFSPSKSTNLSRVEARYYEKLPDREIRCLLCPRYCHLGDKERGYCGVRENEGGTYYTLVYGKVCALNVDPIEKKPFFHFYPGTQAFSLATVGCNVNCKFCQNWQISQVRPEQVEAFDLPPEAVGLAAKNNNCLSIAYTYTEPVVFFEYMVDSALASKNYGIKNVVVTGGHINLKPLEELIKVVDAIKVDLKSFSESFYKEYVRGELKPVLEAIKLIHQRKKWLEIVYLVIPTLNDQELMIRQLCRWLLKETGPDVPLHFSRFHPMYLLKNLPPTPISTLEKLHSIAKEEGLRYVYIGNVPGHKAESTYCPFCGQMIIERVGYQIGRMELRQGRCRFCHSTIPGIWS
ncbi:MAG: AmmeMemoRadiSam system radical SAM enzyme [Candidatus Aminicenantes bacterium]|nr:AmmeMemoRadiSam system radical SAM enzyme [Candidatus Aminicenantes bacterium]